MRSAWRPAAWCFQSFGHACGRSARPSTQHSGVPSLSPGGGGEAVKSVPRPMTSAGSTPASFTACGTAVRRTPTQSPGSCRAHWGGSDAPEEASVRSITPCGNSYTADPSSAPSETRTTTARPESVPKSTPMTHASAAIAVPPARCAVLADDDLSELLDRRLGRRPVEHDLPVAQQVDAVARLKDVHVVVQDHDHRDVAALAQARDEVEDDRASLTPIAASGSSSSRIRARVCSARAIAIAWRWPPDSRSTGVLTDGMLTPMLSISSVARERIARLFSNRNGGVGYSSSRLRNTLWKTLSSSIRARSW